MAIPIRLQRGLDYSKAALEPIETNLDPLDIDTIVSIIAKRYARAGRPVPCDFVAMDRSLNDLFEGTFTLDAHAAAMRIGALAAKMYKVDLRDVALRVADILSWAEEQDILSVAHDPDVWSLRRTGVTFLPFGNAWRDARGAIRAGAISKDGLISREAKQRGRLRNKERDFVLKQTIHAISVVQDDAKLPLAARKLLVPCTTVGQLKANLAAVTDGLELWQAVQVQWHAERLMREAWITVEF